MAKLQQVAVLESQDKSVQEAIRQIGMTEQTHYRWRGAYRGINRDQLKRLKAMEVENQHLRFAASVLSVDKLIQAEATRGNV